MQLIPVVASAALFAFAGSGIVETTEDETIGVFVALLPVRSIGPVVDFCAEEVPELKNDLFEVRAGFIERLTDAGRSLIETYKSDPEFNAPMERAVREKIIRTHFQGLTLLKQQDPGVICPNILENMRHGTREELRKVVEETYEKYRLAGQGVDLEK